MLYGVVTSMSYPAAPATPAWWPDGALAYADFVNGNYGINSIERSLSHLLLGIDAADIKAKGLAPWDTGNSDPVFSSELLGLLADNGAAGMSFVIEFDYDGTADASGDLLLFNDNTDPYSGSYPLLAFNLIDGKCGLYDGSVHVNGNDGDAYTNSLGIIRFAFTVGRDLGGGSWANETCKNGRTVADAGTTPYNILTRATIVKGWFGAVADYSDYYSTLYLRKLEIWPVQSQAQLQALSALS